MMGGKLALLFLAITSCEQTRLELAPDPSAKCEKPRVVLVRPDTPPNATYQSNSMPPERYRGNKSLTVHFVHPDDMERVCNGGKRICGFRIRACQRGNEIFAPNPCGYGMESYGRLICHEKAHALGWPSYHGD